MKVTLITLLICLLYTHSSSAGKNRIDYLDFSNQSEFEDFSNDLIGAVHLKSIRPIESLGLIGFDLGVSYSVSNLKNKLMGATSTKSGETLDQVTFHAIKGLPFGVDLGLHYGTIHNSNISSWSGDISWEILKQDGWVPNMGISGVYTQSNGISALEFRSYSLAFAVSKSFFNFTPYANIGVVNGYVKPLEDNLDPSVNLKEVSTNLPKLALGVNINILLMDVLVAYNQVGEVPSYVLKLGYRF